MIDQHILDLEKGHNKFKMRQRFYSFAFKRALKIYCSVTTYTQKKKKKKKHNKKFWIFITYPKLYLARAGADGVHLSLSGYTLAHRSILISVWILEIHHLLYLGLDFFLNLGLNISLNLGLSLKSVSISLRLDAILVSLSKSPADLNFSHFPLIFSLGL